MGLSMTKDEGELAVTKDEGEQRFLNKLLKDYTDFVKKYAKKFPTTANWRTETFPAELRLALAASMHQTDPPLYKIQYLADTLPAVVWSALKCGNAGDPEPVMEDGIIKNPHTRRLVALLKSHTTLEEVDALERSKWGLPEGLRERSVNDPAPVSTTCAIRPSFRRTGAGDGCRRSAVARGQQENDTGDDNYRRSAVGDAQIIQLPEGRPDDGRATSVVSVCTGQAGNGKAHVGGRTHIIMGTAVIHACGIQKGGRDCPAGAVTTRR